MPDARFSGYVKKQSVSAYESLDAGLTIKTREGDLVTLTSSTFARFDASMYNSRGVMQTGSDAVSLAENHRQITLSSGDSFSFSVVGDLSDEELEDIENIVKGIDDIISRMGKGNLNGAVSKAMSMAMENYDTVAMYQADITYQRSYAVNSELTSVDRDVPDTRLSSPGPEPEILPREDSTAPPFVAQPYPENHSPKGEKSNSIRDINRFVEKMVDQLAEHDDKTIQKAEKPLDKLFMHHMKKIGKGAGRGGKKDPAYAALETARNTISQVITQMTEGFSFSDALADVL
jgi:hypothetical protein